MSNLIPFALNQMVAPQLPVKAFIDLAAQLNCVGVELRNDLKSKNVSMFDFLDGHSPEAIGQYARDRNIRILGLSEVYGFNYWSDDIREQIERLIEHAQQCGAETISLIPDNSGAINETDTRMALLISALEKTRPLLEGTNIMALVEPLGFSTASLQLKSEAASAIEAIQGQQKFKLVHDSFHHFLSGETTYFADQTGIVHISSIKETALQPIDMADEHRILVDAADRLATIPQIKALIESGYLGTFSFEPFSPLVHQDSDIERSLALSMAYIRSQF